MTLRPDLEMISHWIRPNSRVLDLGCGDGALLKYLQVNQGVSGYGIEIDSENVISCIRNDVDVIQNDIENGLLDFDEDSFDYVLMTQTLQAMHNPVKIIQEMLRIGRESIITFPNFGNWRCRYSLFFKGEMPVSTSLPYQWYNTPNIHLCTIRDFERVCRQENFRIMQRAVVDNNHNEGGIKKILPNLFGEVAMYRICSLPKD